MNGHPALSENLVGVLMFFNELSARAHEMNVERNGAPSILNLFRQTHSELEEILYVSIILSFSVDAKNRFRPRSA